MPNITQFAKTAPFDGEIRVFVSESIDGTKIVRALTVDNNAIGGKSVIPTLENLVRISMAVTASGEFSDFTPLSVSRKNTYFFVDNVDLSLATVSSSLSSSIVLDPFLENKFNNSDFEALLSNATEPRTSEFKYEVDRASGVNFPLNYEATVGIPKREFFEIASSSVQEVFETTLNAAINYTGSTISFPNDRDINLVVTKDDIASALGNLDGVVNNFSQSNPDVTIQLTFNVDADSGFASPTQASSDGVSSYPLATIRHHNGVLQTTIFPMNIDINSGSMAGASGGTADTNFYARLVTQFTRAGGSQSTNLKIRPRILSVDKAKEFINVRYNLNTPEPYAPFAEVQESNYTSTGFANARYRGTKTDADDFSGIDPALNAQTINVLRLTEGFISSSNDSVSGNYGRSWRNMNYLLAGISGSDGQRREYEDQYEEVAFVGLRNVPLSRAGVIGEFYTATEAATLTSNTDNNFDIDVSGFGMNLQIGDLIQFTSNSLVESMTVTTITQKVFSNGKLADSIFNLTVLRGQGSNGNANNNVSGSATQISAAKGDRLITIENNQAIPFANQTVVVSPEKVKDSPDDMKIVETNDLGFIFNAYTSASQDGAI